MLALIKNKTTWGLALILAFTLVALLRGFMGMEWSGYHAGEVLAPHRAPDPQVAVVAIDEAALHKYGPWPWPRSILAKLVDTLAADKVEAVGLALDLSAPQNAEALDYLTQLKTLAADPDAGSQAISAKLDEARAALATDDQLAASILRSGRVLVAAPGEIMTVPQGQGGAPVFALSLDASSAPDVELRAPLPVYVHAARGVGFLDESQLGARELPLLVQNGGKAVASLALLTAAAEQGVDASNLGVHTLGGVSLGSTLVSTDRQMEVLLRDATSSVPQYSFDDLINGAVPPERLAGKAVLVGITAGANPPVLREARLASGLVSSDLVSAPFWVWGVRALVTLLVGLYVMLLLPRLSHIIGIAATAFLGVVLLIAEYLPLLSQSLWLPLILPFLLLLLGHAGFAGLHFLRERSGVSNSALSEANRELGLALQSLSRFDQALVRFRQCQPSKALSESLMALGQEHERGRRYSQALEVYYYLQQVDPEYQGLAERLEHLRQIESTPTLTRTNAAGSLSKALSSGGLQKPMLGRYELVKELGRGAMGVVYLGKDAKIGRQVAIKTMALADEFDGETLKSAHDRFFREAETAGRLSHTNIVTIYDVGEDQGLAYIAMDYVPGESLQKYTASGALLPINEAVAVTVKIAEALDYAHKHNVVHRDIKPANIMYERASGRVKITDFGIAAITDLSRTKTGTILGSPLYMSPEQIAGNKLDGRSDLYSLGVTLYQLLRGELPFEAPSLTGLMFKIANEPHPDVTFLRPDIPPTIKVVVDRALQKDPDARFQNGLEMANALKLSIGTKTRTA